MNKSLMIKSWSSTGHLSVPPFDHFRLYFMKETNILDLIEITLCQPQSQAVHLYSFPDYHVQH